RAVREPTEDSAPEESREARGDDVAAEPGERVAAGLRRHRDDERWAQGGNQEKAAGDDEVPERAVRAKQVEHVRKPGRMPRSCGAGVPGGLADAGIPHGHGHPEKGSGGEEPRDLPAGKFLSAEVSDPQAQGDDDRPRGGRGKAIDLAPFPFGDGAPLDIFGGDRSEGAAEGKEGQGPEDDDAGGKPAAQRSR